MIRMWHFSTAIYVAGLRRFGVSWAPPRKARKFVQRGRVLTQFLATIGNRYQAKLRHMIRVWHFSTAIYVGGFGRFWVSLPPPQESKETCPNGPNFNRDLGNDRKWITSQAPPDDSRVAFFNGYLCGRIPAIWGLVGPPRESKRICPLRPSFERFLAMIGNRHQAKLRHMIGACSF